MSDIFSKNLKKSFSVISVQCDRDFCKFSLLFNAISKNFGKFIICSYNELRKCGIILRGESMRLDKFLKQNRIIKRRTVAQEVSKAGLVKKDSRPLKPSYEVKPGDILEISYGTRVIIVKVTDDMKYEILEEKTIRIEEW